MDAHQRTSGEPHLDSEYKFARWCAVEAILLAWNDAFQAKGNTPEHVKNRAESIRFLTDATGMWAEQREIICDIAGQCPDTVRSQALARMRS